MEQRSLLTLMHLDCPRGSDDSVALLTESRPEDRILNSSTGIPLHPLALLTAVLLKAHLTLLSRMSGFGWLATPS